MSNNYKSLEEMGEEIKNILYNQIQDTSSVDLEYLQKSIQEKITPQVELSIEDDGGITFSWQSNEVLLDSCKDTTEMRKLINHIYCMEHLIMMYRYLSEYLMYNDLSFEEFNCIKEMIWSELDNLKK